MSCFGGLGAMALQHFGINEGSTILLPLEVSIAFGNMQFGPRIYPFTRTSGIPKPTHSRGQLLVGSFSIPVSSFFFLWCSASFWIGWSYCRKISPSNPEAGWRGESSKRRCRASWLAGAKWRDPFVRWNWLEHRRETVSRFRRMRRFWSRLFLTKKSLAFL